MIRRAIISGITGHVGEELARQLTAAGVEVHGLTRQPLAPCQRADGVQLHRLDGTVDTLVKIFEKARPDVVFHLAALARREHKTQDVDPFITANILLGTQLLEGAQRVGCDLFVTAGSYLQHHENGEYRAFNLYAATKQAFESLLAYYVDAFGFSAVILTLCNVYGEREDRPTLLTDMTGACSDGRPLHLHAQEVWVDLVHVEDVAAAFYLVPSLVERGFVPARALSRYSVSSGRPMTAADLVGVIERVGNRRLIVKSGPQRHASRRLKPWQGPLVPGWEPRVRLEEGISRLMEKKREAAAPSHQ